MTKNSNPQFVFKMVVPDKYVDTFGHVNNAAYLSLFEDARWAIVEANGYGLKEVQSYKKGPVVLEVNLKFLKELKAGEAISIHSETVDFNGKIGHIKQEIHNTKGELASEAMFVMGFFDLQLRKLIPATPEWLKAIGYNTPKAD